MKNYIILSIGTLFLLSSASFFADTKTTKAVAGACLVSEIVADTMVPACSEGKKTDMCEEYKVGKTCAQAGFPVKCAYKKWSVIVKDDAACKRWTEAIKLAGPMMEGH